VTTAQEADERRRLERARQVALFRYSLIQDVISPHLTAAQRGRRVRQLGAMTHLGPDGTQVRVSCQTINRWKRDYLAGGFDALVPSPRQASPRTPGEMLTLAAALVPAAGRSCQRPSMFVAIRSPRSESKREPANASLPRTWLVALIRRRRGRSARCC